MPGSGFLWPKPAGVQGAAPRGVSRAYLCSSGFRPATDTIRMGAQALAQYLTGWQVTNGAGLLPVAQRGIEDKIQLVVEVLFNV